MELNVVNLRTSVNSELDFRFPEARGTDELACESGVERGSNLSNCNSWEISGSSGFEPQGMVEKDGRELDGVLMRAREAGPVSWPDLMTLGSHAREWRNSRAGLTRP